MTLKSLFFKNHARFKTFFVWPAMAVFVVWSAINATDYRWVFWGLATYYAFHHLGFGIGGHKLFAHRAFEPVAWYPYVAAVISSICFFGAPVMNAIVHRQHHRYADTDRDPHSPTKGRWHAFVGWMWHYQPPPPSANICADLIRDYPFLKTYEKVEPLVQPMFFITVYLINYQLMLIFMMAAVLSYATGTLINAYSHNPKIEDHNKAVDNKLLAILVNATFLHRRHHAHGSAADYSFEQVYDISGPIIKHILTKKIS